MPIELFTITEARVIARLESFPANRTVVDAGVCMVTCSPDRVRSGYGVKLNWQVVGGDVPREVFWICSDRANEDEICSGWIRVGEVVYAPGGVKTLRGGRVGRDWGEESLRRSHPVFLH